MAGAWNRDCVCGGDVVGVRGEVSEAHTTRFGWRRMRRWLPRTLWLLAWSFWLWCGLGLARELPRPLGTPVCRLPLERREQGARLVAGDTLVLTRRPTSDGTLSCRLWDVRSATPSPQPAAPFLDE